MPNLTEGLKLLINALGPEARAILEARLAKGHELITHYSSAPQGLLDRGIKFSALEQQGEPYKPIGLYWGRSPEDVTRLTDTGGYHSGEPNWENFLLGTTPPSNIISPTIEDNVLHNRMMQQVDPKLFDHLHKPTRWATEVDPTILERKRALTQALLNRGPMTELTDVDAIKGMREIIQMSPKAVMAYRKNLAKMLGLTPAVALEDGK